MSRLILALVRLHPRPFRKRFGQDMLEAWEDGIRAARSPAERRRFTAATVLGLVRSAALERVRPTVRDTTPREGMMAGLGTDLRWAVRALLRRPGYLAIAATTIALGIGANTTIYSVIHGVLLTPLDYEDPETLYMVGAGSIENPDRFGSMSMPEIEGIRGVAGIEGAAGTASSNLVLTGRGPAERVAGAIVTHPLLDLFGVRPHLGRDLTVQEATWIENSQVVLGYDFWRTRLGGDPDVVGTSLMLDGAPHQVVGVAPEGWSYPEGAQVWRPGGRRPEEGCWWGCNNYQVVARLTDEASPPAVDASLAVLSRSFGEINPSSQVERVLHTRSLLEARVGDVSKGLWVLMATVGVVLLIACANVANLMLVRGQARRGEIAVRAALGAGRGRLIQSVLAEGAVLAGVGALLGVGIAAAALSTLSGLASGAIPRLESVSLSLPVLGFTVAATVGAVLLFGILPALQAAGTGIAGTMRPSGRGGGTRSSAGLRKVLMAAEVAMSLVLLVGAGLLLRTFAAVTEVDPGYVTENVVRFNVFLPESVYDEAPEVAAYVEMLDARLEAIPGVRSAAAGMGTPLSTMSVGANARLLDRPEPEPGEGMSTAMRSVSPGFFELQEIEVLQGRGFDGTERLNEPTAFMVNRTFAERYLSDRPDPIGTPMRVGVNFGFENEPGTIVGVVEDVRTTGIRDDPSPELYVPHSQYTPTFFTMNVRTEPGAEVESEIRAAVAQVDPDVPIAGLDTIEEAVRAERATTRFYLALLVAFAGLAVLLAAVGLYGVVSYLVTGRLREFGVRVALGADRPGIMGLVLRDGLKPALAGLGVGLLVALASVRVLRSLLYGVEPVDPVTFVAVPILLLAVCVLALIAPARRATRIDPVEALRSE